VTRQARMRWVALSCVLVVAVGVLLTGVRAWAAAHMHSQCRAPVAAASGPPARAPSGGGQRAAAGPSAGPSAGRADANGWRVRAFQAAGCGAWHHVRTRMHRHRH